MIDRHEPPGVGEKHRQVTVASQPAADRLDHERGERRGHDRVDGVATLLEHLHSGCDLGGMARRHRTALVDRHGRTSISVGRIAIERGGDQARGFVHRSGRGRLAAEPARNRDQVVGDLLAVPIGSIPTRNIESEISP